MNCDYCGLNSGVPARWEVTTGDYPGNGITRYPCDKHLAAACGHVAQVGPVTVIQLTRHHSPRSAA